MSSEIIFRDIETFKNPSSSKFKKWGDSAIWGVISKYPKDLQEKFKILQNATHEFLENGFSTDLFIKYRLTHRFMKSFTSFLARAETLEKSFIAAGGIREEIGFHWSCYKIRNYYRQKMRPPPCNDIFFKSIYHYSKTGAFEKFGINKWPELLHEALKGYQLIELERTTIQGNAGLQRACNHLLKISHQIGRIPHINDSGIQMIRHASNRGSWVQFGINSWTDLLKNVFGSNKTSQAKWKGFEGLKLAQKILKEISFQKFPKLPLKSDVPRRIQYALKNNYWEQYDINNWDDLMKSVCKNYPPQKNIKERKSRYLEAEKKLKEFYSKNQRLPVAKDFPNISVRCYQKWWSKLEILSWNDLLFKLFGKVNLIPNKWQGEEGLHLAQTILKNYYKEHNCWPSIRIKPFSNIRDRIYRRRWVQFGIKSWKDFIHSISENEI